MSVDVDSKLIVGFKYELFCDLAESVDLDVDELLDNGELDYASPWYDSTKTNWIVGLEVSSYGVTSDELTLSIDEAVQDVKELLKLQSTEPLVYCTPHVT